MHVRAAWTVCCGMCDMGCVACGASCRVWGVKFVCGMRKYVSGEARDQINENRGELAVKRS